MASVPKLYAGSLCAHMISTIYVRWIVLLQMMLAGRWYFLIYEPFLPEFSLSR